MSVRPVWASLGLLLLAGCGLDRIYGPLEINVRPLNLPMSGLVPVGVSHRAYFSNHKKLVDEFGPGMEKVEEAYERRIADMVDREKIVWAYQEIVGPAVKESMARFMKEHPAFVPKECKRRMIMLRAAIYRGGDGGITLQCGESFVLPLEVRVEELDAGDPRRQPWLGSGYEMDLLGIERPRKEATHVAYYSNLDKLLDECGPGAEKAREIADQADIYESRHVFGRLVDDALVECLERRDLVPPECRDGIVPVHNPVLRGLVPEVGFRCGSLTGEASPE